MFCNALLHKNPSWAKRNFLINEFPLASLGARDPRGADQNYKLKFLMPKAVFARTLSRYIVERYLSQKRISSTEH